MREVVRSLALVCVVSSLAAAACGSEASPGGASPGDGTREAGEYGPMAVVPVSGEGRPEASTGPGTLRIGDGCVTLQREDGAEVLLVWREGDVRWSPSEESVTFVGPIHGDTSEDSVQLADGDALAAGGADLDQNEATGEPGGDSWVGAHDWVAQPPRADCGDRPWLVGSIDLDVSG